MLSIIQEKPRNVVPNWRPYDVTIRMGELNTASTQPRIPVALFPIDGYVEAWRNHHTPAHAGDLISAAILNGQDSHPEVAQAVNFVLSHSDEVSSAMCDMASRLLEPSESAAHQTPIDIEKKLKRIEDGNRHFRKTISLLRKNLDYCYYNPMAYCEMARCYASLGQPQQASRMMDIALSLAPRHRYISRSAARLFLHNDNKEKAHYVVAHNPYLLKDPWLLSAEIATNTLLGRVSRHMRRGIEIINSQQYSSFSLSELSSAVGVVEMAHGNRKNCRQFYLKALRQPNDNSLAQAQWLQRQHSDLGLQIGDYPYLTNAFESEAMTAFYASQFQQALVAAIDWVDDMPYAHRALDFAACVAGQYVKNYQMAIRLLSVDVQRNPTYIASRNNLAYYYALQDNADEALRVIENARQVLQLDDDVNDICLTATEGLALYRKGNIEQGRELYQTAICESKQIKRDDLEAIAKLNFIREEIRSNPNYDTALVQEAESIPADGILIIQLKKDIQDEILHPASS